jgi:hypothetical protein
MDAASARQCRIPIFYGDFRKHGVQCIPAGRNPQILLTLSPEKEPVIEVPKK